MQKLEALVNLDLAVETFLIGYFSTCRRSEKTTNAYSLDLEQFSKHFGGATELGSIGPEVLERWATELKKRQYAVGSARRKFATLKVFFAYWVRKGTLEVSPFWRVRLDLGKEQRLPRAITAKESKQLLEQAWSKVCSPSALIKGPSDRQFLATRDVAALEILFATGMRVGELVALGREDWNDEEAMFTVNGKGGRQRLAFLTDERSKKAVRTYLRIRDSVSPPTNRFFLNSRGAALSAQGIARNLTKLAKAGGVETHLTPHMLRHTVATLLLRHGADIRVVQEVLGHASITMTQRYTHVSKEHMKSTLQAHHPSHHMDLTV